MTLRSNDADLALGVYKVVRCLRKLDHKNLQRR